MVKFSDKGSGWHGESGPHSQARTLGYVPGRIIRCPNCAGSGRESGSSDPRQSVTCPRCGGRGVIAMSDQRQKPKIKKVVENGKIYFVQGNKRWNILGQRVKKYKSPKLDKWGYTELKPLKVPESKKAEAHKRWLEKFQKGMSPADADFSFRVDHELEIIEEHQKLMRQQHIEYGGGWDNIMKVNKLKEEAVARLKDKYGILGF